MARQHYRVSRTSAADAQTLFDVLLDAPGWTRWAPLVSSATWEGPAGEVGSVRAVGSNGVVTRERITELAPPHRHCYTIVGDRPARDYEAVVTFEPTASGTTITWVGSFEPNPPVAGHLFGVFIRGYLRQLAAALAREAEARDGRG